MINNIEALLNILFDSFQEKEIEFKKIDNVNITSSYYINQVQVNKILQIIFETCSSHNYCFSITRDKYSQIKVRFFDKITDEIMTLIFFTIMPDNIDEKLVIKYNKKVNFLKRIKIIPVIGPDGVGKSTILNDVMNTFEEKVFFKRFKKVVRNSILYNIFHPLNKNSVRKKVGKKSVKNQHDDIHYLLCIFGALTAYPYLIFQTL